MLQIFVPCPVPARFILFKGNTLWPTPPTETEQPDLPPKPQNVLTEPALQVERPVLPLKNRLQTTEAEYHGLRLFDSSKDSTNQA